MEFKVCPHFAYNFNSTHNLFGMLIAPNLCILVAITLLFKTQWSQCLQKWGGHKVPLVILLIPEFC